MSRKPIFQYLMSYAPTILTIQYKNKKKIHFFKENGILRIQTAKVPEHFNKGKQSEIIPVLKKLDWIRMTDTYLSIETIVIVQHFIITVTFFKSQKNIYIRIFENHVGQRFSRNVYNVNCWHCTLAYTLYLWQREHNFRDKHTKFSAIID